MSNANVRSHGCNYAQNGAYPAETQIEIDSAARLYGPAHRTRYPIMTKKKAPLRLFWRGLLPSSCCHEYLRYGIKTLDGLLVPETGIEPATFALRVRCSTD